MKYIAFVVFLNVLYIGMYSKAHSDEISEFIDELPLDVKSMFISALSEHKMSIGSKTFSFLQPGVQEFCLSKDQGLIDAFNTKNSNTEINTEIRISTVTSRAKNCIKIELNLNPNKNCFLWPEFKGLSVTWKNKCLDFLNPVEIKIIYIFDEASKIK